MSRMGAGYHCWAAFEDASITVLEERGVSEEDSVLKKVAKTFKLQVF